MVKIKDCFSFSDDDHDENGNVDDPNNHANSTQQPHTSHEGLDEVIPHYDEMFEDENERVIDDEQIVIHPSLLEETEPEEPDDNPNTINEDHSVEEQ